MSTSIDSANTIDSLASDLRNLRTHIVNMDTYSNVYACTPNTNATLAEMVAAFRNLADNALSAQYAAFDPLHAISIRFRAGTATWDDQTGLDSEAKFIESVIVPAATRLQSASRQFEAVASSLSDDDVFNCGGSGANNVDWGRTFHDDMRSFPADVLKLAAYVGPLRKIAQDFRDGIGLAIGNVAATAAKAAATAAHGMQMAPGGTAPAAAKAAVPPVVSTAPASGGPAPAPLPASPATPSYPPPAVTTVTSQSGLVSTSAMSTPEGAPMATSTKIVLGASAAAAATLGYLWWTQMAKRAR